MGMCRHIIIGLTVAALLVGAAAVNAPGGQVVWSAAEAMSFPQAALACKVRMGTITAGKAGTRLGMESDVTCQVISWLKTDIARGKDVELIVGRGATGFAMPGVGAVNAGEVYIVMLQEDIGPYRVFAAMKAVDAVVPPQFGRRPGDRLLAELVAMWRSKDAGMRVAAIEQIGIMRDKRGAEAVNEAAKSEDVETARAAVIAQYRMKIAPDAKRVMELFNEQVMDVWYQESGIPRIDAEGHPMTRLERGHRFIERGLPDFDYATYVREGIKKDWVRKDEHTLYVFFGVPWKVQRQACVPELMKLLDDPDKKVRWWAVCCLTHTVEDTDRPQWKYYERHEAEELAKWRTWQRKGTAFMPEPTPQMPEPPPTVRSGTAP